MRMERFIPDQTIFTATYKGAVVTVSTDGNTKVNNVFIHMTKQEKKCILLLAQARGKIIRRRSLCEALYKGNKPKKEQIICVLVYNICTKLGMKHGDAGTVIRNVWGRGYAFGSPPEKPIITPGIVFAPGARWVESRKVQVATALRRGSVTKEDVYKCYPDLTPEELDEWLKLGITLSKRKS